MIRAGQLTLPFLKLAFLVFRIERDDAMRIHELEIDDRSFDGDRRRRVVSGLPVVGQDEAPGILPFTHVAAHQGRLAAGNAIGRGQSASYRVVPRVTSPTPSWRTSGSPNRKPAASTEVACAW